MKIKRVILKKVRNLNLNYTFEDPWKKQIPASLLLIGPNGSGKSTILEAIAYLWQVLSFYLRQDQGAVTQEKVTMLRALLERAETAGVEIVELDADPVWIFMGHVQKCREFAAGLTHSHRIIVSYEFLIPLGRIDYWYAAPGETILHRQAEPSDWHQHWSQRLTENILGKRADLPNVVFLESDSRVLLPVKESFSVQPEPDQFHWLAHYEPTTARRGSLHNYLYNLKVVDEHTFQTIVDQVNAFLVGKQLKGFDRHGNLLVEVKGGGSHSIDEFSSGEKQVLLMLATITRWLRPGGIVLIDEPDLHLHPSLTTAFVGHLRRMIAQKEGQLIIASHAPELWEDFTPSHRVELGSLNEVRR